ncbi:MAG: hypothetical protein ACOC1F_10380 [Myxococcota bacterium]
MRTHAILSLCTAAVLGLASNACSLLGTYANSATSLMSQPGATSAAAAPTSPSTATPTAATPTAAADATKPESPKAPSTVSVTLRNGCSETVKLFFGDKPKFGSGRYSSLGSNTRTNHTFQPGDQLWIVDDAQNGIENVAIEAGMREVEVTSSCDAFRTR